MLTLKYSKADIRAFDRDLSVIKTFQLFPWRKSAASVVGWSSREKDLTRLQSWFPSSCHALIFRFLLMIRPTTLPQSLFCFVVREIISYCRLIIVHPISCDFRVSVIGQTDGYCLHRALTIPRLLIHFTLLSSIMQILQHLSMQAKMLFLRSSLSIPS